MILSKLKFNRKQKLSKYLETYYINSGWINILKIIIKLKKFNKIKLKYKNSKLKMALLLSGCGLRYNYALPAISYAYALPAYSYTLAAPVCGLWW